MSTIGTHVEKTEEEFYEAYKPSFNKLAEIVDDGVYFDINEFIGAFIAMLEDTSLSEGQINDVVVNSLAMLDGKDIANIESHYDIEGESAE